MCACVCNSHGFSFFFFFVNFITGLLTTGWDGDKMSKKEILIYIVTAAIKITSLHSAGSVCHIGVIEFVQKNVEICILMAGIGQVLV